MTIPVRFNGIRTLPEFGPPAVNTFGMVSSIGETFSKGIDDARKARLEDARAKVLMEAGQGGADYESIGRRLIAAGEVGSGLGFLKLGQEEKTRKTQSAADAQAFGLAYGGESSAPSHRTTSGTPRANIERDTVHIAETEEDVQRLERATGMTVDQDLDKVVRTVYGEAGNEGIMGQRAVASVIANRARQSGMTPTDVVLAKGQFEPWSDPAARARMESLDPNSPEYKQLAALVEPALRGQAADPTGGATHFYAPKAQAALGRNAPSWDDGTGRDIGNHRFFNHGYGPQGKVQVAQADAPAPGAQPAQGFAVPGQPQSPMIANLERALANPNLSEGARRALQSRLDRAYKEQDNERTADKDRYEPLKSKGGQVVGLWDKKEGRQLTAEEAQQRGISPQQPQNEALDFSDITGVRKEIQNLPSYKSYTAALPAYTSIVDAAKRDNKMADLNLVYGLAKIMDPTSVVREGEMIMVNNAQGLSEQVIGMINSVNSGARLTAQSRTAILREAQSRMEGFKQSFDADIGFYRNIAKRRGISEDEVIPNVPGLPQYDPRQFNGGSAPTQASSLLSPQPMAAQGGAIQGNGWKIIGVE